MRNKFTSIQIANLVMDLVGEIEPVGESHIDDVRYNSLLLLQEVVDCLIDEIQFCLPNCNRPEYSMRRSGQKAKSWFKEKHDWLDDLCEEMTGRRDWNDFLEGTAT